MSTYGSKCGRKNSSCSVRELAALCICCQVWGPSPAVAGVHACKCGLTSMHAAERAPGSVGRRAVSSWYFSLCCAVLPPTCWLVTEGVPERTATRLIHLCCVTVITRFHLRPAACHSHLLVAEGGPQRHAAAISQHHFDHGRRGLARAHLLKLIC